MDSTAVSIRCRGIKKSYGMGENRVEALKGIDLDIHQKELTLLIGPSGSGKTTLLSILTLILTPDEGELYLSGHSVHEMSENEKMVFRKDQLGIVFQSFFLVPALNNLENVTLPLIVAGQDQKKAEQRGMALLKRMNLEHRSHSSPAFLSKGQQQRVAIARAIVNEAKIVICDEPTSALDQASGQEVMSLLKQLASEENHTVVVVSHDHRIFPYADRIIELNDGQITSGQNI